MNNDKENKLWDNIYKKVVKKYPNKSINSITKIAIIIFKKIKNKNPEKYKPILNKNKKKKKRTIIRKKRRSSSKTSKKKNKIKS